MLSMSDLIRLQPDGSYRCLRCDLPVEENPDFFYCVDCGEVLFKEKEKII